MKSVLDRRPNIGIRSTRLTTQNSHVIRVPELSATPSKRCNSNDVISKLEIRVGELRATFLRNHSSVLHSGVVLPNRCNACGALLPRLFLLSGGNCYHRAATRRFYGSKTPRCAAGLCGGLSVLCSTCSPPRPDAPKQGCLGRSGRRFERRFAVRGGVAAKLQTHWVKTVKNRPFWRNGSTLWRIWYQSWCVVRT